MRNLSHSIKPRSHGQVVPEKFALGASGLRIDPRSSHDCFSSWVKGGKEKLITSQPKIVTYQCTQTSFKN